MAATSRVADLTVEELRALIRLTLQEVLQELASSVDPDADLTFRPEVADYLRHFLRERPEGMSLAKVVRSLDLDD